MTTNYTLSEYQVIFGQHDDGFLTRDGTHLRVDRVTGCSPLQHHPMKDIVAEAIDEAERANREHTERKNARFRENYGSGSSSDPETEEDETANSSASQALEEMLGGVDDDTTHQTDDTTTRPDGGVTAASNESWLVPPDQVKLLELTDDSRVRSSVAPRTFRCQNCNHFELLDPATDDLTCPDCNWELRQYPLVYACPRCANTEPMQPRNAEIDAEDIGVIACDDCGTGHYHLHHEGSLSTAQFECSNCDTTEGVRRICRECHIPANEDGEYGATSVMKPTPSDASSLISPMVKSALFIDDDHISLSALEDAHQTGHDPYRWHDDDLSTQQQQILKKFWGLDALFTVRGVNSLTAVYGYQTRVTAEGTDVDDADRLTRTFNHGDDMKRAYVTQSKGRGLVFSFDTDRLIETINSITDGAAGASYEEQARSELETVNEQPIKQLVDEDHGLVLVPMLHALEHALFEAAAHEIGMDDVLGSKILVTDGAIVLYERENVGAGGLAQLTLESEGQTLKKFLRKATERVSACGQLCESGCPSCIYTDDFDCRPYLPSEVNRWVPPNALLNRNYADQYINAH